MYEWQESGNIWVDERGSGISSECSSRSRTFNRTEEGNDAIAGIRVGWFTRFGHCYYKYMFPHMAGILQWLSGRF